ncbi:MAG: hypothetical protein FRX49_04909 [Trebouxia sp. A1-2]|nr:MAG: hypothetical protein FRX49_04909 [Trebouxia sp. A1-2]
MARRRVQYGVVNASDADVGAGAPGFRATWQSKDDLRQQVLSISDVPNNGKLYFWDGQLWLRWDDPDDLPGPEGDPLRIKIVCPENTGLDIRQQLARIEAATLNTFHHMFAPSISDLSQRSKWAKMICTTTYNADDRPAGQLWCMVLGRYLQDDMIKASHIYKRDWPAQTAALLKLGVDTAANLFSAQKKIESAFDRFRLIIVPNSLSDYILHILDPSLSSEIVNNTILNASGAAVKFADIDGNALQFVTETRPAKRAFAWHAEEALHFGKAVGWPAASLLTVPPSAWSSDTCDSGIRDQYFRDLLELQASG